MKTLSIDTSETLTTDIRGVEGTAIANDGRIFVGTEDAWIYMISPDG